MLDASYRPLKDYVARRGGIRLAMHARLRDQLVEAAVADWPTGCDPDKLEDVVVARLRLRVRNQYGSIMAMLLISVVANIVGRLVLEWWRNRHSHRVLMEGWAAQAQKPSGSHDRG
jgi:hypothetical protein